MGLTSTALSAKEQISQRGVGYLSVEENNHLLPKRPECESFFVFSFSSFHFRTEAGLQKAPLSPLAPM